MPSSSISLALRRMASNKEAVAETAIVKIIVKTNNWNRQYLQYEREHGRRSIQDYD
jgi:hypothetical protein